MLLSGCIVNPPVVSPDREQFTVRLAPHANIRISAISSNGRPVSLSYGQRVELPAKVRSPRNYQNPGEFDYVGWLAAQQIYWTGSVSSPADIHVLPGRCGSPGLEWLYDLRTWALDRIAAVYPQDQHTAGMLQATLLGETSGIERRWTNDFRVTGTYHAIVISGLHISVLAMSVLLLLRILHMRRFPSLCVASIITWIYAFVAGLNAPAIRSAAGFFCFVAASFFFRRVRALNMLGLVGIIYLLIDPGQLFDPSFQLSFLSAAAIAAFAVPFMERYTEPLRTSVKRLDQIGFDPQVQWRAAVWRVEFRLLAETLHVWTRLPLPKAQWAISKAVVVFVFAADAVVVSTCMQFALALPMISYFHRLSVTGLSANVIVVPLLLLVVPLGFASIATGWHPIAALCALLLRWAEATATWHASFEPGWRLAAIPLSVSVAFAGSLILLAYVIRRHRTLLIPVLTCSAVLFAVLCIQPWKPILQRGVLEVDAIDVNQGDSIFVSFPNGRTLLVDAGGVPGMERMKHKPQLDMGEDVVSPYLWSRRLRHLDYAALSHGHSDHMAGLPAILDNFRPAVLWTGAEPDSPEWQNVQRHAAIDGVHILSLRRGSPDMLVGDARVRVLAPSPDYVSGETARNDDSLVLEITYGKRSVLLTGDAERPVEDDMLISGELEPVTLLKVGHHGSRTSSAEEFVDRVSPQFAFISDGYKNQFHHPHQVVLDRFAQHHTAVFRTDEHGLLSFRTDGDHVDIQTFR